MLLTAGLALTAASLGWWVAQDGPLAWRSSAPTPAPAPGSAPAAAAPAEEETVPPNPISNPLSRSFLVAEKLLERLKNLESGQEKARANQAVLTFRDPAAYHRFLARAAAAGFRIIGRLDGLQTVCVGYSSTNALAADLNQFADDYASLDPNLIVSAPETPETEARFNSHFAPIGDGLLNFLGATGDISRWGAGVTIAVLDSGVIADSTFGTGRLRTLDVGYGVAPLPGEGHGTAVASIAAGMSPDAPGAAPAANVLSIRITGADGMSDSFALAQGLISAVDAGAQIINVSLGAYGESYVVTSAIDYASSRGVVIVAAAGNDQAAQLTSPASDPRVLSVGAVDAAEQQVMFSNSGDNLKLTAPGYGVQSAWVNGQRITMDGTSASAPVVSGSLAAMMSQNPGLTANQAWQLLQQYASDGGPAGRDPNYGYGIVNLGWAMGRNDFNRVDTAVSSHYLDLANQQMEFTVQNRSARGVGGLNLNVWAGLADGNYAVPWLAPGAVYAVRVPVDYQSLRAYGRLDYSTELINPPGIVDTIPSNNRRANSVSLVKTR